ncbi:hypothetical protein GEMRC1_005039 [Eukaryota sp. GEM-RC1]
MADLTKWRFDLSYEYLHVLLSEMLKFCETLYNALKREPLDFEATRSDCIDFIKCIIDHQIPIHDVPSGSDLTNFLKLFVKVSFTDFIQRNSNNTKAVVIPKSIPTPIQELQWISINRLLLPPELLTEFAMCYAAYIADLTKWNLDFSHGCLHGLLSEVLKFCETLYNALKRKPLDFKATRSDCIDFIKCIIDQELPIDDIIGQTYDGSSLLQLFSERQE